MVLVCRRPLRPLALAFAAVLLCGCGSSTAPATMTAGAGELGSCNGDVSDDAALIDSLVPDLATVQARQAEIDSFGNGFRVAGNAAEIGYIHQLAADLRALGASEVSEEPYTFNAWTPKSTALEIVQGPSPGPVPVAYFSPDSGSTGPDGLTGPLLYFSALSQVNIVGAVYQALLQNNLGAALLALQGTLDDTLSGTASLTQAIAVAGVSGKIVIYDAPRLTLPIATLEALAEYVNNSSGTLGPLTPYARPYFDELLTIGVINLALKAAGASAVIAVLDYPTAAADDSYVPFGGTAIPSVPGLYLDRDTGAALKQQLLASGATPVLAKLTLDADQAQATSYNVAATIPGQCPGYIVLSSHSDGPNSVEDNGPAAILSIAGYFLHAPVSQRRRGLKLVFTGGHFEGGPGITSYLAAHKDELQAHALTVLEIEHLGAREWLETSPGVMALDGLPEPQVLYAGAGSVQQAENIKFAQNFDRTMVTIPLPFGEGISWASTLGLPKTQFITGPVYLLNGPMPQVTSQFTDYDLERRQITAFIQMVLDLNTYTDAQLLADKNLPTGTLPF